MDCTSMERKILNARYVYFFCSSKKPAHGVSQQNITSELPSSAPCIVYVNRAYFVSLPKRNILKPILTRISIIELLKKPQFCFTV